ncbi:bifunctional riboflavin kinase/FAD synthetase [Quadrisphaera sp. DSM 44207]|uniref:bifunctional riboflavin kinase/FAD synthetase n=1 Tax=Quadrisphaera sp. DSM 44207 TaxID=1881057 RepID=UPI00088F1CC9|nr:bifunctional riboflavin kinase/FAD synthetase [Quadrisphaera sp. DSM 44207]SDQ76987.1 riboflavin kinase / FMN adenylyltransferase [Quadrisphaera sp. DSM 44207]
MERWHDLPEVPEGYGPSVVAIGNFDGVHRGHRSVLAVLVEQARRRGARAVAVTFVPHPLQVLHPERAPQLLAHPVDRLDLLEEAGLDAVLEMPFTRELASWTPERFVVDTFVKALGAAAVVVGRDVRFGRRNSGDLETMRRLGREHGFEVLALEDEVGEGRRWSSTWAREALAAGDVATAAEVLGRPYRLRGVVVHGDHRGRELGYPTANLAGVETLVPADGVYAGWMVRLDLPADHPDRVLPAAVSLGTNPTFDGLEQRVEAYALDRTDLDLYGERVAVDLVERLRPTLRFGSVDELVTQMDSDVERCRQVLGVSV